VESKTLVTGYRRSTGWATNKTVYFAIESSKPFASYGLELAGKPVGESMAEAKGELVRGHLDFKTSKTIRSFCAWSLAGQPGRCQEKSEGGDGHVGF